MQPMQQDVLFLVGNIPGNYHSSDLRKFFFEFSEKKAFSCFHFRHRPEHERTIQDQGSTDMTELDSQDRSSVQDSKTSINLKRSGTLCCVVNVKKEFESEFIAAYSDKKWTDRAGNLLPQKLKLTHLNDDSSLDQQSHTDCQKSQINVDELLALPELNPPNIMPQGNVGTPVSVFMELIKNCRLPCHVIKKLKLNFPIGQLRKRYGAVPMSYSDKEGITLSDINTSIEQKGTKEKGCCYPTKKIKISDNDKRDDNQDIPSNDDYDAEEWERYEALHEDVDKQGRSAERLFENEMEVVWEKGGSGLVFYTDAKYWDEQDGDFDEQCSKEDDWDVDMSLYYGYNSADKTALDMRKMEIEKRLREGSDPFTSNQPWIGGEGFGGKILKKKGWKEGSGLGVSGTGISEPLEPEGQHPTCKKGFGYHGEKIVGVTSALDRPRTRDVLISTVYDKPIEEKDCVSKRAPPTSLKYRQKYISKHNT